MLFRYAHRLAMGAFWITISLASTYLCTTRQVRTTSRSSKWKDLVRHLTMRAIVSDRVMEICFLGDYIREQGMSKGLFRSQQATEVNEKVV